MIRHYTATGYVVNDNKILLHWHDKVEKLLPPGGHINNNEDPVQAVLREIREETGLKAQVIPSKLNFRFDYPHPIVPPITIMLEDILDKDSGFHQHIDLIYICQLLDNPRTLKRGWLWISEADLSNRVPIQTEKAGVVVPPEDVRCLGIIALQMLKNQ